MEYNFKCEKKFFFIRIRVIYVKNKFYHQIKFQIKIIRVTWVSLIKNRNETRHRGNDKYPTIMSVGFCIYTYAYQRYTLPDVL